MVNYKMKRHSEAGMLEAAEKLSETISVRE